jgi:tryptophanyl-tRNA synthetase
MDKIVLTGDRPTGKLHLGHYVGSLKSRLELQEKYKQYVMIADVQALTDNYEHPEKISHNVFEVLSDYLAIGIDPLKTTIFIQSQIKEIAELTIFYLNLVTISRLKRNPTVKLEINQKGFKDNIPAGFLMYPVSQAADITCVKAELVPVGEDQLPMIEQTNEIVRSFNRIYNCNVLKEAKPIISNIARLPGIDGKSKMSKSLNNAIYLSDSLDEIKKKVMMMYTDPNHIKVSDPGKVEGNVVFQYLDFFDNNKKELEELKLNYQKGGISDVSIKKRLIDIINELIEPIRKKKEEIQKDKKYLISILKDGYEKTSHQTQKTLNEVKEAMKLVYF